VDALSVVFPTGFRASGSSAGIKSNGILDVALVAADAPVAVAAVFTTSLTAAPPVLLSRLHVASGTARAVIVNSGAANAGTGAEGMKDAQDMAAATARALDCPDSDVLVCSTGPIGGRLPIDRIVDAVPNLVAGLGRSETHGVAAARGILTTDSVEKMATATCDGWAIGGMAKGAGMVRPDMATMLAFLTTDAVLSAESLAEALQPAVDVTFNSLNIDGCQSTNDTVVLMASGASGVQPDAESFAAAVEALCRDLALQMARDAEGATKVVQLEIVGAADDSSARRLGMAVADSALVKSSFYGGDPNWGRILAALGVAGEKIDPDRIEISYDGTVVCAGGTRVDTDEDALAARLAGDFAVRIVVGDGAGAAAVITTDLTPEYVVFNGDRA
jgi:glutamate N-acetyltransferase / amino-acid N-acetyltransferase